MTVIRLAWASLLNRRGSAFLTIVSIALSVVLLLGVEKLRHDAREGFANTISGTDLIVGARSGSVQLLLYSVFRMGNATSNISWDSYQQIAQQRQVAWSVPISLGDAHRGYRVMGTTPAYFERYQYGRRQALAFAQGREFTDTFDVVLGAEVARKLAYGLDQSVVLSHGTGSLELARHEEHPFRVVGILAPTGTPVDRTLHVSLAGLEAIHLNWQGGAPKSVSRLGARPLTAQSLEPKAITAFLLGLKRKTSLFSVQRSVNTMREEPLQAIIPGVALQELWSLMRTAEQALRIISVFVVLTSLLGLLTVILATLETRRREMAVLRAVGARLSHLAGLFVAEVTVLTLVGMSLGVVVLTGLTLVLQPIVASQFGIHVPVFSFDSQNLMLLGLVLLAALVASLIPALRAYRLSLSDGLSVRM